VAQVFFRLIARNPPTTEDFLSYAREGIDIPEGHDPALAEGISVQATLAQMRNKRYVRRWCLHIAELHLPENDQRFRWLKTGGRGHFTIWGAPEDLIECVVAIHPRESE
jgi:hypothetical protein